MVLKNAWLIQMWFIVIMGRFKIFLKQFARCLQMRIPKCCEKWAEEYPNFKKAEKIWPNIFKLSFNTTRETKLQSFPCTIVNKAITCRKTLSDINLSNSPKCLFCNEIDNIRHFFLFCQKVHNFWNSFVQRWNRMGDSSRLWLSGRMYYLWPSSQGGRDLWSPKFLYFKC